MRYWIFPSIIGSLLIIFLIIASYSKRNLDIHINHLIHRHTSSEITFMGNTLIDSLYNYSKNILNYKYTLIEFTSTGCIPCKKMQYVLENIRNKYPDINIIYLDIHNRENQTFLKYFKISTIPTTILLNKEGKEVSNYIGFISENELITKFKLNN